MKSFKVIGVILILKRGKDYNDTVAAGRVVARANQLLKTRKIKLKQREHRDQPVFKPQGVGGMIACSQSREDSRFVYG